MHMQTDSITKARSCLLVNFLQHICAGFVLVCVWFCIFCPFQLTCNAGTLREAFSSAFMGSVLGWFVVAALCEMLSFLVDQYVEWCCVNHTFWAYWSHYKAVRSAPIHLQTMAESECQTNIWKRKKRDWFTIRSQFIRRCTLKCWISKWCVSTLSWVYVFSPSTAPPVRLRGPHLRPRALCALASAVCLLSIKFHSIRTQICPEALQLRLAQTRTANKLHSRPAPTLCLCLCDVSVLSLRAFWGDDEVHKRILMNFRPSQWKE